MLKWATNEVDSETQHPPNSPDFVDFVLFYADKYLVRIPMPPPNNTV